MDDTIFELLTCFSNRKSLSEEQLSAIYNVNYLEFGEPIRWMLDMKYLIKDDPLEKFPDNLIYPECHYQITFKGKAALAEECKNRKKIKHNELRAWSSLVIAFLALIVSIISIAIQFV